MFVKQKNSYIVNEWEDTARNRARVNAWGLDVYTGETETGADGLLYVKGHAPAPAEPTAQERVQAKELQTGLTRAVRELVLAENSGASDYVRKQAQEIEALAAPLRADNTEAGETTAAQEADDDAGNV